MDFFIDRGGTFTDLIAYDPSSDTYISSKLLSVDPDNYPDAPREGIKRILEMVTGKKIVGKVPTKMINRIRMATTVATNALLERKGQRVALLITKGFADALEIGNQARPAIFDLDIKTMELLYEKVIEIDERVLLGGTDDDGMKGITGETVKILKSPSLNELKPKLLELKRMGITSIAICLCHSYTFSRHEEMIGEVCKELGFDHVTLSSRIMPMIKLIPRGNSACADAYLTPTLQAYINSFFSGFDKGIDSVKVEFMQSDGALSPVSSFTGFRAVLSGPAGGVVGYAKTSFQDGGAPVIGFDMGGTSTDVSRFDGQFDKVLETTTAGITIQAPQLDIQTVAAGGGSRLFFRNGMFLVGPESTGADPGPVCYKKGGDLAITDANLILGRLLPDYFPKIFGKSENEPLDIVAATKAFDKLSQSINLYLKETNANQMMTVDEIAYGFVRVANESMCRPIRALTQKKGYDTRDHVLACFGGAGAQHACAIASILGIQLILIHKYSAVLSAYGLSLADVIHEVQEPSTLTLSDSNLPKIQEKIQILTKKCSRKINSSAKTNESIIYEVVLNLRYEGTDASIMIQKPSDSWNFKSMFDEKYQSEFGFTLSDRNVLVDDIIIKGVEKCANAAQKLAVYQEIEKIHRRKLPFDQSARVSSVFWGNLGRVETPIFELQKLEVGDEIYGPALIVEPKSTIAIEPNCVALVTKNHVVIQVGTSSKKRKYTCELDPIQLSIFGHRFMSIAEQMGFTLQKTSISTNIKERLDFSCAIFGPDSGLVANAPHIPVHLGSMQEAVKWQMNHLKSDIKEGDVIVTNHPAAGGSHLPDITVITPVFNNGSIVFFVASRGHHADIGGLAAGSMPPNSTDLFQEGAAIKSFKLVQNGVFDEKGITNILCVEPAKYDGCSGTRSLKDNISDLKAQVAANHRGIILVKALIKEYGLEVVQAYMQHIRENAETCVRDLLRKVAATLGTKLYGEDFMDDGTPIRLSIEIDKEKGSATFDFSGTGDEVYANWNAPRSVTYSAIIYCLRCLINLEIPLNQGALVPVEIIIPENSILNPSDSAAVVGGNVMTSQRLCDVILKAFEACAASQGCCNNLTFGRGGKEKNGDVLPGFGYYETIGGGAGAGPQWDGKSGVHTHMTNTRLTDPEILERRYPVYLREFGLRKGSGGDGLYKGGDGIVREIEFLEKLHVSMLSERRVFSPYGLKGGSSGKKGVNYLFRKDQKTGKIRKINFGGMIFNYNQKGKNSTTCYPGDCIRIETPGGGGWGEKILEEHDLI